MVKALCLGEAKMGEIDVQQYLALLLALMKVRAYESKALR